MAKYCIECNKKERLIDRSYAGFNLKKEGRYPFLDRIEELSLPGNRKKHFLCKACANKREVRCKVHGFIRDDDFKWGLPPNCKKCDKEYKSIKGGVLPSGFRWLLPLTSIHMKSGKVRKGGILAVSSAFKFHVIKERVLLSANIEAACPMVSKKNGTPVFEVKFPSLSNVTSCQVEVKDSVLLEKSSGPWFGFWDGQIANALNQDSTDCLYLVSVEWQTVSHDTFSTTTNTYPVTVCDVHNNKLFTYPDLDLPSLDNLMFWRTQKTKNVQAIELCFNVAGVPQLVRLDQLYSSGGSLIFKIKRTFRASKKGQRVCCDLSSKGLYKAALYPSKEERLTLFEIEGETLFATPLPQGQRIRLSTGFAYGHTHLLVSMNHDIVTTEFANKDAELVSSLILAPKQMVEQGNCQWGTFLDRNSPSVAHTMRISNNTVAIDDRQPVLITDLQDKIPVNNIEDGLSEIVLSWEEEGREEALRLVCPEPMAYDVSQKLEVGRAEAGFDSMEIQDFYRRYGELKVSKLLFVLFSDIIMLNRELNIGRSMDDLAAELKVVGNKGFHKNKELRRDTLQKLLLFYVNLPRIERRFEYLANYYPYYLADIEYNLITDAFGEDKAREVWPSEDRRIRRNARRTASLLQANMQRVLFETDRAVTSMPALYDKNKKTQQVLITKVRQGVVAYGPPAATVALIGTRMIMGLPFFLLGEIYTANALESLAKHLGKSRLESAQIERIAKEVLPKWRRFMDTLQVNIKETSEQLCDENLRCVERDRQIYDSFSSNERREVLANLVNGLQKRILEEINNQYVEVTEGSGIRLGAIVSDIESLNDVDIRRKMDDLIPQLPWT